jgi:beta-galactosidase
MTSAFLLAALTAASFGAQTISLDGSWMLCRTDSAQQPAAGADWKTVQVPSLHAQIDNRPYLWYRRTVEVPATLAGRHLFLRFEAVRFVAEVYLNGQKVGGHFGGWEPFEIDISAACRPGKTHELVVRVQDVTGVIDQPMDYAKREGGRFINQAKDSVMTPVGSQCAQVGIWQPVSLLAREDVYLDDVFVQTSLRRHQLSARVTVRNLSDRERRVRVENSVAGGPTLRAVDVVVPARATVTATPCESWANPRLWGPEDPHLYHLATRVSEAGQTLDTVQTRFGFREFWTDGADLVLNGTPMKFLATAGHPRGSLDGEQSKAAALDFYQRIREAGCVAMRLHANVWPRWWYEAADEVGMPIVMESAFFCWSDDYALSKPAFWKNYRQHLQDIVRAHQNHPSIVMISLENEILHCGGERDPNTVRNLAEAGRLVKSLDPTRPILFDADGDPEGVADVVNLHYPLDFNKRNLWPEAGYWLETGMELASWPKKSWQWDRKKPLYFGEFLHIQHFPVADPYSALAGDDAYRGHQPAMALAKAAAWEMQIEAYRAADVSGLCPWTLTETGSFPSDDNPRYLAIKRAYAKNAAFVREYDCRFYSSEKVERTVYLYNDTLHAADLVCSWRLTRGTETVDAGERRARIDPARKQVFKIALRMPEADRCTPLTFTIRVHNRGQQVYERSKPYWVYPRSKADLPASARLAVFGAVDGPLAQWLAQAGGRWQTVTDLARLPAADVLLIAPHALDRIKPTTGVPTVGDCSTPRTALAAFVERGGAVIVLEQDSYDSGLLPAELVDRGSTIAFARSRVATLTGGLVGNDYQFWRGDQVVARRMIAKPVGGRFRAVVDAGGPQGLVYVPLLEVPHGRGRYLLSQLLVGEKLGREPVAQVVLENLVRYGAPRADAPRPLGVVQGSAPIKPVLDQLDVCYEDLTGRLAGARLERLGGLLVDASCEEVARCAPQLRQYMERGGRVILHGADRGALEALSALLPERIVAQHSPAGPLMIAEYDAAIDGLTGQELYWYGNRKGLSWHDRTPLAHDVCSWTLVPRLPAAEQCLTVEAEAMQAADGHPTFGRDAVSLSATGAISKRIAFAQAGEYAFGIRGRGTPLAGVYPEISLAIDGRHVGSITLEGNAWNTYNLSAAVEKGTHDVCLAFTNDAYDPVTREDRNSWLDRLDYALLPPARFQRLLRPAALVKMSCGSGSLLIDEVNWDREAKNMDQAARYVSNLLTNLGCAFRGPLSGVTITSDKLVPVGKLRIFRGSDPLAYVGTNGTVTARVCFAAAGRYELALRVQGTEVDDIYPHLDVLLDGRRVGEMQLRGPGWQVLRLPIDAPAGEHTLGLRFTNDFYRPPADRNLTIAWLRIRP